MSSYPNSPQTQVNLQQFAANFSKAMTLKPTESGHLLDRTIGTNDKEQPHEVEPDFFLTVNVNDNAVERIPLTADSVDVQQFVQSLSLKYKLSPHKAAKIQQTLSSVIREAKQSDTLSVISLHTHTSGGAIHNGSCTPEEQHDEDHQPIFINLLSP